MDSPTPPAGSAVPASVALAPAESVRSEGPGPPPTADHAELLTRYLAAQDVRCPRCDYNLRGVESGVCPECGESLSLRLERESTIGLRHGDYRLFLLLGFGWPMLAGVMNSVRTARQARAIAGYYSRRWGRAGVQWESVDWMTWLRLGWAMYLAVAGFIGLLIVARFWRRPCSVASRTRLTQACLFVTFVYIAWHVGWFITEL